METGAIDDSHSSFPGIQYENPGISVGHGYGLRYDPTDRLYDDQVMTEERDDDADETEGRRLYRARANALARAQISMAKRKVKLNDAEPICRLDHGSPARLRRISI